jgi:hypothetical protein
VFKYLPLLQASIVSLRRHETVIMRRSSVADALRIEARVCLYEEKYSDLKFSHFKYLLKQKS